VDVFGDEGGLDRGEVDARYGRVGVHIANWDGWLASSDSE
jgi:hypothetical protein